MGLVHVGEWERQGQILDWGAQLLVIRQHRVLSTQIQSMHELYQKQISEEERKHKVSQWVQYYVVAGSMGQV